MGVSEGERRVSVNTPSGVIFRNFSWVFMGNVVYAASQWLIVTITAKLGTPSMVGYYSLGLAVTAPIMMGARIGLRNIQATDPEDEFSFDEYLLVRVVTTSLALVVIALVAIASYTSDERRVVMAIAFSKAVESIADIIHGLMQKNEEMGYVGRSLILKALTSVIFFSLTLYLTRSIFLAALALGMGWAVTLFLYDIRYCMSALPKGRRRVRFRAVYRLVALAWPLGFTSGLLSLNTNLPRYFIDSYLGEAALGLFSALAYTLVAGNTVVQALGQAASPRLARYFRQGNMRGFVRLTARLVLLAVVLGVVGIGLAVLVGPILLTVLYTPEYAVAQDVFVWLMVSGLLSYVTAFLNEGLTAIRYVHVQLPAVVASTVVTLCASWWLIPRFGLPGAAWAMVLSVGVRVIINVILLVNGVIKQRAAAKPEHVSA